MPAALPLQSKVESDGWLACDARAANGSDKRSSIGLAVASCLTRELGSTTIDCALPDMAMRGRCVEWEIVCLQCLQQSCNPGNPTMPVYVEPLSLT
jgi:hypothetical protein